MDTKKKVEDWAKRMGYKGNIPNCFKNVCGPETVHIWEQLVTKVKPKDEIEHVKRNIIVQELNGNLPEHAMGRCKEIQVYKKKNELKIKKINLSEEISEKIENLENIEKSINFKVAQNENLKEQIRGNKQKEFLYKQKCLDFEKKILNIQEKLNVIKNWKSLKNQDQKEIMEVLNKRSQQILMNPLKLKKHSDISCPLTISSIFMETIINNYSINSEQSQFLELEVNKSLNQKIDILNNKKFIEDVKKTISKYDYNLILSFLSNLINDNKSKIIEIVSNKTYLNQKRNKEINTLDFIYADDIKNKLMILKYNKIIGNKENDFKTKLSDIYDKIDCLNLNPEEITSMRELIQLKLKEIETLTTLDVLQSNLNNLENPNIKNDLESINLKIGCIEKKLFDCDQKIDEIVSLSQEIDQSIKDTQRETEFLCSGLQKLISEAAMLSFLLEKSLNKKEIETFKNYDLFYNKKVVLKKGEVFTRDLLNGFMENREIDDCLKNLRGSLKNFYSFPEVIISELIRNKITSNSLNSGLGRVEELNYQKYALNQLEEQEFVINRVVNDLEVVHKRNVAIPKSIVPHQEKVMKFWLEMPLDKFVDKMLMFNEKNFEYYKKLYESFYKKL